MSQQEQLPVFHIQARPLFVPPELESMSAAAQIRIIDTVAGRSGESIATAGEYRETVNATLKRQHAGYFTIDEAAQVLADSVSGVSAKEMIRQMIAGNQAGKLLVRNHGDKMPLLDKTQLRPYIHLVSIKDVNRWLVSEGVSYTISESTDDSRATSAKVHSLPIYQRLQPRRPWKGVRMAATDVLRLTDAAKFASSHAKTEVSITDILLAASRGEIPLRAIAPRSVQMLPTSTKDSPIQIPAGHIQTLPLEACQKLANIDVLSWRSMDGYEPSEGFGGQLCRYTRWELPEGEPDLEAPIDDCRLTGADVHALADSLLVEGEAPVIKMGTLPNVLPLHVVSEQLNAWFGGSRTDTDVIKLALEQDLSVYAAVDSPATYVPVGEGFEGEPNAIAEAGSVVPLDKDTLKCLVLTGQGLANGWSNRGRGRAYELQHGTKAPRVTLEHCLMEIADIEALIDSEAKHNGGLEAKPEQYPAIRRKLEAHGLVLISEAAEYLSKAHGLNAESFLEKRMLPAVREGNLRAVTVVDLGPIHPLSAASGFDAVAPADINAWLESAGFAKGIRWPEAPNLQNDSNNELEPIIASPVVAALIPESDAKPWTLADPRDPPAALPWYTPARYFARQLAMEKPTLLANRELLADKVANALFNAGFKKRGGIKRFDSGTVLKALVKVDLG
ncbi:hypothetical protein [Rhodoferax mekongensis]|uniref:hypothetical protein n=1 Tax=Rhodoferax mekongensis TaxID=3068341 RepID=UPI0028BEE417|nr:hypothetical protein [Rhodoferax sp. TBRC 17199]MDT7514555.1 hypothetical protein [Rhodoferax sp. TBRC 17199]